MKATILCITTGNPLTMAGSESRQDARYYRMAPPGQKLVWGPKDCEPQVILEDNPGIVYKSGQGKEYPYGLAIIEDLIVLKDDLTQNRPTFFETTMSGMDRAKDIVRVWMKYGGVLIAGDTPTEVEIDRAILQRTEFARHRIDEAISGKMKGMSGHGHVDYNASDRAWATEMGAKLPDTYEQLERIAARVESSEKGASASNGETAQCPACIQPINPLATKCRHCGEKFGEAVGKIQVQAIAKEFIPASAKASGKQQ